MLKYTLDPEVSLTDQFWNDMYSIEKNVVGNRHSNRANKRKNGAKFKKTVFMPRRIMAGTEGGDVNIDTFHSNESRNRKLLTSDLIKETDTVETQVTTSGIQSLIAQNSTLSELISKSLSLEIQIYDMAVEINRKQCLFLKIPSIDCN